MPVTVSAEGFTVIITTLISTIGIVAVAYLQSINKRVKNSDIKLDEAAAKAEKAVTNAEGAALNAEVAVKQTAEVHSEVKSPNGETTGVVIYRTDHTVKEIKELVFGLVKEVSKLHWLLQEHITDQDLHEMEKNGH